MQTISTVVYPGIFDTSSNIGKQQKKKRLRLCWQQELEPSTTSAEVGGSAGETIQVF